MLATKWAHSVVELEIVADVCDLLCSAGEIYEAMYGGGHLLYFHSLIHLVHIREQNGKL